EPLETPNTPAGRQFSAWQKAINSGDRSALQEFMDKSMPGRSIEPGMAIGKRTGGYELKKVEESSETRVVVLVQERGPAGQFARVTVKVAADAPDGIAEIRIQRAQPPAELTPAKLTAAAAEAARSEPPFRQFSAWLEVFNAGDREKMKQFLETHYPTRDL